MSSAIPSSPSANDQVSNSNDSTQAQTATINVDPSEVEKFNKLAGEWWSNTGAFATLHEINPLRLNWIEENVKRGYASNGTDNVVRMPMLTPMQDCLARKVLDVGCGGGILSESMARRGADVTGVDLGT